MRVYMWNLLVRADIPSIWFLTTRLVKSYVLGGQHVKYGVLPGGQVQT